jgi:hypothetical protein
MSRARGVRGSGLVALAAWALMLAGSACRAQAQNPGQNPANSQRNGQQDSQPTDQSQSKLQVQGLAFWEPKPEVETALMNAGRGKDPARYEVLRKAFAEAGCTSARMREETVGAHEEKGGEKKSEEKNLFCVLPGGDAGTILVVARYDENEEGAGQWGDAVALPLLYRALEAAPRRHAFEFVEIAGKDGEKEFLDSQKEAGAEEPAAEVVMGGMGLGYPVCSAIKPSSLREMPPTPAEDLCRLAHGVAVAMRLVDPTEAAKHDPSIVLLYQEPPIHEGLFAHSPVKTKVVLWSEYDPQRAKDWYGKDFDFAAWFLCWADRK